jgi:hypothetical protein
MIADANPQRTVHQRTENNVLAGASLNHDVISEAVLPCLGEIRVRIQHRHNDAVARRQNRPIDARIGGPAERIERHQFEAVSRICRGTVALVTAGAWRTVERDPFTGHRYD